MGTDGDPSTVPLLPIPQHSASTSNCVPLVQAQSGSGLALLCGIDFKGRWQRCRGAEVAELGPGLKLSLALIPGQSSGAL